MGEREREKVTDDADQSWRTLDDLKRLRKHLKGEAHLLQWGSKAFDNKSKRAMNYVSPGSGGW